MAPDSTCAILEVGEARVGDWFSNVTRRDLAPADDPSFGSGGFAMVVIHQSLGGCATLQSAVIAARGALREGGLLAVYGENRMRITGPSDERSRGTPRATSCGFRWALARAGFTDVSLYVAHP